MADPEKRNNRKGGRYVFKDGKLTEARPPTKPPEPGAQHREQEAARKKAAEPTPAPKAKAPAE